MGRTTKPLSDFFCKNAKPSGKPNGEKYFDGLGLYLLVKPAGKYWRIDYSLHGKRNTYAPGTYPETSLTQARKIRDTVRAQVASGTDPNLSKRHSKREIADAAALIYSVVAREFHSIRSHNWSDSHSHKWMRMSELYLFPEFGNSPIGSIRSKQVLDALRKVEKKGILSTAQDLQQIVGQVFRYAAQVGHIEKNPIPDLKGALKPHITKHFAAQVDPEKVGELMRAIDGYSGSPVTRAALQISPLIFQRPGNVRAMKWSWIDLKRATLTIPPSEMKAGKEHKANARPHLVPLSKQVVKILEEIQLLTGSGIYVFPSVRSRMRPMSDGTINAALRRLDYGSTEQVAHGFRAMARTMLSEQISGIPAEVVEAQLAHKKSGPLGAAYDRADFLNQRKEIMQVWADYLDHLKKGDDIIKMQRAA